MMVKIGDKAQFRVRLTCRTGECGAVITITQGELPTPAGIENTIPQQVLDWAQRELRNRGSQVISDLYPNLDPEKHRHIHYAPCGCIFSMRWVPNGKFLDGLKMVKACKPERAR